MSALQRNGPSPARSCSYEGNSSLTAKEGPIRVSHVGRPLPTEKTPCKGPSSTVPGRGLEVTARTVALPSCARAVQNPQPLTGPFSPLAYGVPRRGLACQEDRSAVELPPWTAPPRRIPTAATNAAISSQPHHGVCDGEVHQTCTLFPLIPLSYVVVRHKHGWGEGERLIEAHGGLETELHPTPILLSLSSLSYVLLSPSREGRTGSGAGQKAAVAEGCAP